MKASIMLEHDSQWVYIFRQFLSMSRLTIFYPFFRYATILAFDVKIERDAQELADSVGVKIFQADIIYHLFDKFTNYREELKQRKRDEHKHIAVFPCKLKVLPQVRIAVILLCILLFLFIILWYFSAYSNLEIQSLLESWSKVVSSKWGRQFAFLKRMWVFFHCNNAKLNLSLELHFQKPIGL